jgi:uncharacterized membrane protein
VTTLATLYDWLMLVHVLAAMVWVGGVLALSAFAALTVRSRDAEAVARFVGSLRVIGPVVFAPAPLLLIGFGSWMVVDSAAWNFGQTWIWLGIAFFGAAFLVGAAFQSRAAIGARRAVEAARQEEALRQLRRWLWGSRFILVLLVLATWDMVFKPGL